MDVSQLPNLFDFWCHLYDGDSNKYDNKPMLETPMWDLVTPDVSHI